MASEMRREAMEEDGLLDLPEGGAQEELETEVRRARAELDDLRRRQEQIEKEKLRLEELSRRQEELETGRSDMVGKLERSLATIHRETEECQQRLEHLQLTGRNFKEHLRVLETLRPGAWSASEAPKELGRGMAALEEAKAEFAKAQARIALEAPDSATASEMLEYGEEYPEKNFTYWLRSGFAFTLPLQILGLAALVTWILSLLASR